MAVRKGFLQEEKRLDMRVFSVFTKKMVLQFSEVV